MAYVRNRFISEKQRVISDILEIANTLALEGFLAIVDIKKHLILLITASYCKFFKNLDSV